MTDIRMPPNELAGLSGALAAGAVGTLDVSLLLYPMYFLLVNGSMAIFIHHRRSRTGSIGVALT